MLIPKWHTQAEVLCFPGVPIESTLCFPGVPIKGRNAFLVSPYKRGSKKNNKTMLPLRGHAHIHLNDFLDTNVQLEREVSGDP
jgi:hypothetical protein